MTLENSDNIDDHGEDLKNGANGDDQENDTADESTLPPVTPAIIEEYQKEVAMRETAAEAGRRRKRRSLLDVCGVPSWLMCMLILLIIAVIVGTILGVVLYESERGIQPPSDAPSLMATMEPS
jgi:hypothetical protein